MKIAIDLGKRKSYVVMEDNGEVVKEGYTETTKYGFSTFFGDVVNPKIIVEACSATNRIANMFDGYDITVANPKKVRVIAESVKKTDKIYAHTLLDLYNKDYLPQSWLPPKTVRDARDLCRNRDFLVRQRVAVKNRIRYQAYLLGKEFSSFSRANMAKLRESPVLDTLVRQLDSLNALISDCSKDIETEAERDHNACLLYTIPGIGKYSALAISAEIGDIFRFDDESKLFSYVGLVPRVRQSGNKEFKGHITKGNVFLKTILIECVQMHIRQCPNSFVTKAYYRIKMRTGPNKAKIAAARRLLLIVYWMLKRDTIYRPNE